MKAEKHGVALIINNKTFLAKEHKVRMETDRDEQNLIETWLFLGYYIVVVRNITRDEMARTFEKIDTLLNIAEGVANDSFVCCILSHAGWGRCMEQTVSHSSTHGSRSTSPRVRYFTAGLNYSSSRYVHVQCM